MASRGRRRRLKPIKLWREIPILLAVALVLALLIKTFLVQAFSIPSGSMENTIHIGDRVLVNKLNPWFGWQPQRGQVIVFHDPGTWLANTPPKKENPFVGAIKNTFVFVGLLPSDNEKDLIKRVIGVPGDEVKCCDAQGRVTVNGVPLDESYLFQNDPDQVDAHKPFDVHVAAGHLWVMGDHRGDSSDSRFNGQVPLKDVVGHAFVLIWPLGHARGLGVPATFGQKELQAADSSGAPISPLTLSVTLGLPWAAVLRRSRRGSSDPPLRL